MKIFTLTNEDGIAVIRFDVTGAAVNTWTEEAVAGYEEILQRLEAEKAQYKGVVFISGKDAFHAGANLNMFEGVTDPVQFKNRCTFFNQLFLRMENLGIPTVAAITGQCLGGGYEFTLAMTARIATDSPKTLVGLPECNVGVFPGGGGTQRLPRLIGYAALEMILKGQVIPAVKALEMGMVDRVVSANDDLLTKAKEFVNDLASNKAELKRPNHDFSGLDDIIAMARKGILKATRGRELPGPMLALKAMQDGLKVSLEQGLSIETDYFIEVLKTPESKGMINTFFLKTYSDKPQTMVPSGFQPKPMNKFAVLGFGVMGRGIVIEILRRTLKPILVKDMSSALEPGKAAVQKVLEGMAEKGRLALPVDQLMKLIIPVSDWTNDFKDVDVVIEAVFEDPALKEEVYKSLCAIVPEDCIIASNTSSLPVNLLAKSVKNPKRFAGFHFFSPVWKMELVEVIRGQETNDDTINNLIALAAALNAYSADSAT